MGRRAGFLIPTRRDSPTSSPTRTRFVAADLFRRPVFSPARRQDATRTASPPPTGSGPTPSPAGRARRRSGSSATARRCRRRRTAARPASATARSTTSSSPTGSLELYADGATMVLQGLQLTDPHLGRVANNLALALDHPVQINAYLSPAAARGLELHFDFHDVFVLQLDGRKRWRVWEPLPRTRDPVRSGAKIPLPTLDELGEPLLDLTLTSGDCLYLPRGFPHAAETIDAASSHLTIGVLAITWQRAVRHAVDAAVAAGELTASIPARSLDATDAGARRIRRRLAATPRSSEPAAVAGQGDLAPPAGDPAAAVGAARRRPRHARRPVTPGPLLWLTTRPAAGCGGPCSGSATASSTFPARPTRSSPSCSPTRRRSSRRRRRRPRRRVARSRSCSGSPPKGWSFLPDSTRRIRFECAVAAAERAEPVWATASQVQGVAAHRGPRLVGPRRGGRQRARPPRPDGLARGDARSRHPGHHDPPRPGDPPPRADVGRAASSTSSPAARGRRRRGPGGVMVDDLHQVVTATESIATGSRARAGVGGRRRAVRAGVHERAPRRRAARRSAARWSARLRRSRWADRVWECSHIGGDRFAGNLVLLPESLYFGRCDGPAAERVLAEFDAGRLDLARFRGRSTFTLVEQAAEHFVRTELGARRRRRDRVGRVARQRPGVGAARRR